MHELGIITNLFTLIDEIADEHKLRKVTRITVKLGKLQQIVPDMLQFAFESVAKGSRAEDAVMDVEYVPIKMKCKHCAQEFIVDDHLYICPGCEQTDLDMLEGMEILLESIEGEP